MNMKIKIEQEPGAWYNLSMRDRAKYIHNSVKNHFVNGGSMTDISIDDIRHQFNDGGTKNKFQYRADWYAKHPEVIDYINQVADIYNINPVLLADRMAHEGAIDSTYKVLKDIKGNGDGSYLGSIEAAKDYKKQIIDIKNQLKTDPTNSYLLSELDFCQGMYQRCLNNIDFGKQWLDYDKGNTSWLDLESNGFWDFGLDTVADRINSGQIQLLNNESWEDTYEVNEKHEKVHAANGITNRDSIGIQAAMLKAMRESAQKDNPNADDETLDRMAMVYYNRGEGGARSYLRNHPNNFGYNFNPGIIDLFQRQSIQPIDLSNIRTVEQNVQENPNYLNTIFNQSSNKNTLLPQFNNEGNLFYKGGPKEILEENSPADLMRNDNIGFQQGYYPKVDIPKQSLYEAADNSGVTLVPLLGDAIDASKVIYDTSQGNYGQAALGAGFLLLPNIVEKPLKRGIKTFVSKLDWSPDTWFYKLSQGARSTKHNPYTIEDAERLVSHLDEYADIEQKAFEQGQFILNNKGNVIVKDNPEMSPQEWIIRHSKAMEPWNDERISTGVSKRYRENFVEDPNNVVTWGTTTSPNDVLEYASSPAGGEIPMTKDLVDDMLRVKRENVEDLQQAIIEAKNQKRNYIVRYNKAQNLYLAEQRLERLKKNLQRYEDEGEDLVLNGGQVYQIITPKIAKQSPVVDAQGFNWDRFPYEGSPSGYTSTDHLVNSNRLEGYDISNIINVRDTKKELGLDPLNEKIINNGVPRKSILGNTGDLDINKKGLFTEIALPLGLTALVKTLNTEKAQEEKLFGEGGNTSVNEAQPKNDWRADSPNKQAYIKDLDEWITKNPTFKGSNGAIYNTADFRDVLIQLVGHESSYRPNASTGSYTGYYQIHRNENPTLNQHTRAFKHLDRLFQDNITDYDLKRAKELGINHATLLMKYWNQGNHVNNYLHHGIDHEDGAGTKISLYGNDMDADFDMTNYVNKAITDDYALVPKGGNLWNIAKLARNKYITNYANQRNLIEGYTKEHNPSFGKKVLQVGDTIWLTPTNISEEPVILQKVQQADYKVNYDNPQDLPWYNVFLDNIKRTLFGWEPPEGRYDFTRGGYLNKK